MLIAAVVCLFRSGSATYLQQSAGFSGYAGYNGPQAVPVVLPSGHIADTQEVAAARNAHYAALSKAQATSGFHGDVGGATVQDASFYGGNAYSGPLAAPLVLSNGYLADTRDVADAKTAHFSALQTAKTNSGYGSGYGSGYAAQGSGAAASFASGPYRGPLAAPVVLPSGYIADTEAVAAAKGAHFNALSQASATAGYHGAGSSSGKHWA